MLERGFRMVLVSAVPILGEKLCVRSSKVRDNLLKSYNMPLTVQRSLAATPHLSSQLIRCGVHFIMLI